MKRATLVLATSVALFLSGVSIHASAATRKYVNMPSDGSVVNSSNSSSRSGDLLRVPGDPIEGEYIPSSYKSTKGTKLPVKPTYDYSIPRTLKGMTTNLRGGIVGAGLTIGLSYMLDQVGGFIDENGRAVKEGKESQSSLSKFWCIQANASKCYPQDKFATPYDYAKSVTDLYEANYDLQNIFVTSTSGVTARANATMTRTTDGALLNVGPWDLYLHGTCEPGYIYDDQDFTCVRSGGVVPLTDADYDLMEAAANAKDSDWLKERLREHCEGGLNPQSCYESLRDSVSLSGPSSVTEPGPTTTTTGPSGTTTTTGNAVVNISYGDTYYDYSTTKTTTVTRPDGSTETSTETEPETEEPQEEPQEEMPTLGDPYAPYISKLNDIKTDVAVAPSVVSPIGYSSWYSFGGGCTEIHAELPVIGNWSTNYCPYIYDWVRPILAFLFVVFTWHYCRELWSEAVIQARPM